MNGSERDFIGYGAAPPDPQWPGGARLALNIVVNYEEGSEYAVPEGDGRSEQGGAEMGAPPFFAEGNRNLAMESMFEYGSRAGFWRLMKLFRDFGLPATIFGCALALERNPQAAEAIRAAGHDVCCHGWRWIEHFKLSEEEERTHIEKAVKSLKRSVGERPLGWYCRYGPGENTRRLIVEEGGFLYDSDAYNDDLPYWVDVGGTAHLVVPYALDTNDAKFAAGAFGTGEDFEAYLRDSFDELYREGSASPKMMSIGLHTRLAGRPGRIAGLRRFLAHVRRHDDVWVCRRLDIARHWHESHKPERD